MPANRVTGIPLSLARRLNTKIEMPISYEGDELTITFDPRFVGEFLRVLEPERQVKLDLIGPERAAVLRADEGYTYVIMPLSRER